MELKIWAINSGRTQTLIAHWVRYARFLLIPPFVDVKESKSDKQTLNCQKKKQREHPIASLPSLKQMNLASAGRSTWFQDYAT